MNESLQQLTVNLTGSLRREMLNGKDHFVVPMTLIVPGVLNGSGGPVLYTKDENQKSIQAWNGMPLVLGHPSDEEGNPLSARTPDILNKLSMGQVLNTVLDENGILRAEGWFDIEKTQTVDNRVFEALKSKQKLELSTGLGIDPLPAPEDNNVFSGETFTLIATNYRPDHVAILPDSIGACSIQDGCGVFNELSHDEIREQLRSALTKDDDTRQNEFTWVVEVFDNHVIYEKNNQLFQLGYKREGDVITVSSETPIEVRRETRFTPVTNEDSDMKLKDCERKEKVNSIIANCKCWTEDNRSTLNSLEDDDLIRWDEEGKIQKATKESLEQQTSVANAAREGFEDENGIKHVFNEETQKFESIPKEEPKEEPVQNASTKVRIEDLPDEIRADIEFARNARQQQKDTLIAQLTDHIADDQKQAVINSLQGKEISELQTLTALVPQKPQQAPQRTDYSFASGAPAQPAPVQNEKLSKSPLRVPTLDYAAMSKS